MSNPKSPLTGYNFRSPEFKGARPEEFEFRDFDGKVVRKDRWEMAFRTIASEISSGSQEWEISDIVMDVRVMRFGEIARQILAPMPKPLKIKRGPVTEADLWAEQYQGQNPEDYEIRGDGSLARKDRWEMGVREIAHILGIKSANFEIDELIKLFNQFLDNPLLLVGGHS
jgi:hypothetical protein